MKIETSLPLILFLINKNYPFNQKEVIDKYFIGRFSNLFPNNVVENLSEYTILEDNFYTLNQKVKEILSKISKNELLNFIEEYETSYLKSSNLLNIEIEDFYTFLGYSLTHIPQWGHSYTLISILDRFQLTVLLYRNFLPKDDFEVEKELITVKRKFDYKSCEAALKRIREFIPKEKVEFYNSILGIEKNQPIS